MSMKDWEQKVLAEPGAADRVAEVEEELRLAAQPSLGGDQRFDFVGEATDPRETERKRS